jgi:hypothetical protein
MINSRATSFALATDPVRGLFERTVIDRGSDDFFSCNDTKGPRIKFLLVVTFWFANRRPQMCNLLLFSGGLWFE